jgi:CRISPR/Cas system endoribonuclease Cas6 (RAMP superfamily)
MSETTDKIHPRLSSPDAARYFRYMADFVGFGQEDAEYIRKTQLHLLRYPPTRAHFLNKEGKVDKEYLELRMYHQANFWRRTASGVYDDEYASFVDYVGRAHTSEGADPKIYIPERYVIGMVGFVQYAISEALETELVEIDPQLQSNAVQAWNKLMMVLLEMLSSAYDTERQKETYQPRIEIDEEAIRDLAVESYERSLGMKLPIDHR